MPYVTDNSRSAVDIAKFYNQLFGKTSDYTTGLPLVFPMLELIIIFYQTGFKIACMLQIIPLYSLLGEQMPYDQLKNNYVFLKLLVLHCITILIIVFFANCTSSIPITRGAKNLKRGEFTSSVVATSFSFNNNKIALQGDSKVAMGVMFPMYQFEYGISDRFNMGVSAFNGIGEFGGTLNCHYQLKTGSHNLLRTLGCHGGWVFSLNELNDGHNIIIAPVYMFGLQNGFFTGFRYTHFFTLRPIDSLHINVFGRDLGYKRIHNQGKIESFVGYDFNEKCENGGVVSALLAYNPVFNWWEIWIGLVGNFYHHRGDKLFPWSK